MYPQTVYIKFWLPTIKIDAKKEMFLLVVLLGAFSFPGTCERKG